MKNHLRGILALPLLIHALEPRPITPEYRIERIVRTHPKGPTKKRAKTKAARKQRRSKR